MKIAACIAMTLLLAACDGAGPPARGDYMLQWYPRTSSDYGELVPGFKTLAMCRRAGSGKTIAAYGGLNQLVRVDGSVSLPGDDGPWFECMTQCRPYMEGSYLLVCKHIAEFKGIEATVPR